MNRRLLLTGLVVGVTQTRAADEVIKPKGDPNDPGRKPEPNKQGHYDCILKSMETGQVTEIRPKNIQKLHPPRKRTSLAFTSDRKPFVYWTIQVDYKLDIVFGNENASASAYIRNQEVHFWLYEGSGELVP